MTWSEGQQVLHSKGPSDLSHVSPGWMVLLAAL